eukprot:m.262045 g.262045  ORF g.262045 m.262045 type:complete len:244 (+) comp25127_c0_seq1:3-734(+)
MISGLSAAAAGIAQSLVFRDCAESLASDNNILLVLDSGLEDVEARLNALAAELAREQQAIERAKAFSTKVAEQATRIKIMQAHLPARLPGLLKEISDNTAPAPTGKSGNAKAHTSTKTELNVNRLAYVRKDEFDSVPTSSRGRLTCEQVNNAIDAIHAAATAKYRILTAPRASLGEPQMKKLVQFREQETDETRGLYFLVDDDLKSLANFKLDTVGKACLLVLRALRRIREERSGGIHRYILC